MKTINRKPLFLALAGITALGAVGTAQAVSVNPTGLGQVLLYPYYTVKGVDNPYNTLISIVNTTASTKAVKIRFREGKASKEVLDFNIFLSPYDMWTASLEPAGGAAGGVKLFTNDTSCTIPKIPATGVDFRNSRYIGDGAADNSLARLREGYFEVIEMATYTDGSVIAKNSKHTSSRVPKDCSLVTDDAAYDEQRLPQGGLTGTASLVSPGSGLNAATDPTVLVNFKFGANYQDTGQIAPDMSDADTFSTTADGFGNAILANWTLGEDAVSAALMKNAIINEFVLDPGTASATDWVITFPTKGFYVSDAGRKNPFQSKLGKTGSCDDIVLNTYDREEQTTQPGGPDFSPSPTTPNVQICWEANVLTFNNKNLFSSSNTLGVDTLFINGWARMDFHPDTLLPLYAQDATEVVMDGSSAFTTSSNTTFTGLPVIGFAVQTFRPSLSTSYAGTFYHRYEPGTPNNLRRTAQ
jgi:hypothetical protein